MNAPRSFRPAGAPTRGALRLLATTTLVASGACFGDAPIMPSDRTIQLVAEAGHAAVGRSEPNDTTWKDDSISVSIAVPDTVSARRPVRFRIMVHNGRSQPVELGMVQQRPVDLVVAVVGTPIDSGAVWSLPADGSLSEVTVAAPLGAGRDTTLEVAWLAQDDAGRVVPPGAYRAKARVATRFLRRADHWSTWRAFTVAP